MVVLVDEYDKPILDNLTQVKEALLSSFEVENIGVEALLFQTGYLTIVDTANLGGSTYHTLGYPNREVREVLAGRMLGRWLVDEQGSLRQCIRLFRLLEVNDFAGMEQRLTSFFASIPRDGFQPPLSQ